MNRSELETDSLIALTGATGFLGSHIADALLGRGYCVRASVRRTSDLRWVRDKPIETMEVTLAPSPQALNAGGGQAIQAPASLPLSEIRGDGGAGPSAEDGSIPGDQLSRFLAGAAAVVHCAGVVRAPSEAAYYHGNVETTRHLLHAAAQQPSCRVFILVSSLAAAGPAPPQMPKQESDPCQPITNYGRSKLAAEQLLTATDWPFRTVILRPPALYGPRDRAFLLLFKLARLGWLARLGQAMAALSLVDGRDAAAGAVALLETEQASGPYFVDDGHTYDWDDVTAALALAFRRRIRTVPVPLGLLRTVSQLVGRRLAERIRLLNPDRLTDLAVPGWVCQGEKLRHDTGFAPTRNLTRGFRETLTYYRQNGWLHAT
jgi:nucleoside-diphosphate-sugar epimerase